MAMSTHGHTLKGRQPMMRRGQLREAICKDRGISRDLDRLEKAANKEIQKTLPWFRYKPGQVADVFREDLCEVVTGENWRQEFVWTRKHLREAAKHIYEAVGLVVRAAERCPTINEIPPIVHQSAPQLKAKFQRLSGLSPEAVLPSTLRLLQEKPIKATFAPEFLKAMLLYAARCQQEAEQIDRILKARDRRYDRLAPILKLVHDVQSFTGKPNDIIVARLLSEAFFLASQRKSYTADAIRKLRHRYLSP